MQTPGIHHVSSIAAHPQRNLDFYGPLLGLRPVKLTVNFDLPETYHLYYGDLAGSPGTILTMFPWPNARRGRPGAGQIAATGFAIAPESLGYWRDRLRGQGVGIEVEGPTRRFDEEVLRFTDHDGLVNELVAREGTRPTQSWESGPVPPEHAIAGFSGVTLHSRQPEATARVLTELLGFEPAGEEAGRQRFVADRQALGAVVDLAPAPDVSGTEGTGTVHHVAFRARDDAEQAEWRERVAAAGLEVTPVRDRQYFRSIYFREPGGVLFEIATDQPGFATDETVEQLGSHLKLPPWLETRRPAIERGLLPITLPSGARIPA
ncbi:MAG TPA: ring-cleaving dioxygenase [Thermomicrobiaceae bacterium]|nr:ring-cleaving dioxygenase [Thermomicrobiaceae bacterium]